MEQKITINVNSTLKYLQFWNGVFNLTTTEVRVLATLVDSANILEDPNICSAKVKKAAARADSDVLWQRPEEGCRDFDSVYDTSCTMNGLNSQTAYVARVRAGCSNDASPAFSLGKASAEARNGNG